VHWVCLIQKLAGSSCHFFFLEEKTFFFDQPKNLIRSAQFFVLVKPNFWAGRNWAGQTQILFLFSVSFQKSGLKNPALTTLLVLRPSFRSQLQV
jgi:hypothetical protein